ncbi:GPW/gp25 family protein [Desulfuribacillus alkaliarsenatis]|uniref:IraD/Gp25-like domain-containing protein n=1 Tax=Desulfuribacillus alkaliarsenatis TaxID=766136 RepID=A0A1E5G2K2_9FIRM|nr:GPW/gp25 family protein [Desulfuribacillus alkaliarsenatis]OEF97117.1 hypothetical protein BHF68_05845 [Desulfuribacillus alkaliarsenatis]
MVRGWKFPIEIDAQTGMFKTVAGDDDIREAIRIILTTKVGERIGARQFGSNLFEFMFESINYTELKELEYEIVRALNRWEPRIYDLEVEANTNSRSKGKVYVVIKYRTDKSMTPEEMAFHFEVNEGINF